MAQVTIELRNLMKTSNFQLFDFDYEFDDPIMKADLEQTIIDYFQFYEIGEETPDRFKQRFKARWCNMIYYYNKLHNTTVLKYNPLTTISQIEKTTNTQTSESENTNTDSSQSDTNSSGSDNSSSTNYDYPQTQIPGGNFASGSNEGTGSSSGEVHNTATSTNEQLSSTSSTSQFERELTGSTGLTYQDLIKLERSNIINIKQQIIEEMKPCFILVY